MIQFQLFDILFDWLNGNFSLAIGTITFPVNDVFEQHNIFCFMFWDGKFYLEILSFCLIGSKGE